MPSFFNTVEKQKSVIVLQWGLCYNLKTKQTGRLPGEPGKCGSKEHRKKCEEKQYAYANQKMGQAGAACLPVL